VRVLQVVAADRWTGAAATALQLAEALRLAGVDCHFAFRRGNNLEARLRGVGWCHAVLVKETSYADMRRVLDTLHGLAAEFDLVHCHLPHDHLLVRLACRRGGKSIFRSVRHPRHLRPDPYHRWLFHNTAGAGLANSALVEACRRIPALARAPAVMLPVALEPRFLASGPGGVGGSASPARRGVRDATRVALGIPVTATVAGVVGKLAIGRGQDLFLHALAGAPGVWGLVVGHGAAEAGLRRTARRLDVANRLAFSGYVEEGLENLYAAMDLFVFPAAGSDHAHRAVAEAAGCAVPSLAADLPGVHDVLEPGSTGALFPPGDAAALAVLLRQWSGDPGLRERAGAAAARHAATHWTRHNLAASALELYRLGGAIDLSEPPSRTETSESLAPHPLRS
jgi:glycosyltransferase involved in cell wall biosynthesis